MSFKLPENVHETTLTTGTGTIVLSGAVSGKFPFSSQLANGDTVFYVISDSVNLEAGVGQYSNSVGQNLSRDTVYYSTNGNSLVNWGSGTRNVMCALHGEVLRSLLDPTASNGMLVDIGENLYTRRSIAAGSNISVSNGDGVAANPTISVAGGSGSGLDADTLDGYDTSTTAAPNMILVLNGSSQLPASITGNAATATSAASATTAGSATTATTATNCTRSVIAGSGLNTGGVLTGDVTIHMNAANLMNNTNVLVANAGTGIGVLGSYAELLVAAGTTATPGAVFAANLLRYSNGSNYTGGSAPASGTWRCMGHSTGTSSCLWLRIT